MTAAFGKELQSCSRWDFETYRSVSEYFIFPWLFPSTSAASNESWQPLFAIFWRDFCTFTEKNIGYTSNNQVLVQLSNPPCVNLTFSTLTWFYRDGQLAPFPLSDAVKVVEFFSAEQISAVLHATFRAVVAFPPRREQYNGTKVSGHWRHHMISCIIISY